MPLTFLGPQSNLRSRYFRISRLDPIRHAVDRRTRSEDRAFGIGDPLLRGARLGPGNPRPRLFRLPDERAIVNRMGFNNAGAEALADRLRALGPPRIPLGVSVGKSRVTPVASAACERIARVTQSGYPRLVRCSQPFTG